MSSFQLQNGTTIWLENKPFAQGGEGDLYKITKPIEYSTYIVKLYKKEKLTPEREKKIQYLVKNPPRIQATNGHHTVVWAKELVYQLGKFVGFLMPLTKGEKLELLCHAKLPQTLNLDWQKFALTEKDAFSLRLKLCFNIAVALYQVHELGKYVLVDMKPDNIMVQSNGLISLIDMDSVEVLENGKLLFSAPVTTPEYTPAEYYQGLQMDTIGVNDTWDRFSLAIIFYRLLFGIHPYIGTCVSPYETCNDVADKIKNGLFANGKNAKFFKIIPPPHKTFLQLLPNVQKLFLQCFDDGHLSPTFRPSAEDWCRTLAPQTQVKVNRPLPSEGIKFLFEKKLTQISFLPNTDVNVPTISFLSLENPKNNFGERIWQMFAGKNPKDILQGKIIQKQKEIQEMWGKKPQFEQELKNIVLHFNQYQNIILSNFENECNNTKSMANQELQRWDSKSRKTLQNEVETLQNLYQNFLQQKQDIEKKVNNPSQTQSFAQQHEKKTNDLQNQLYQLQRQEETEYQRIEKTTQQNIAIIQQHINTLESQQIAKIEHQLQEKIRQITLQKREIDTKENEEKIDVLKIINAENFKINDYAMHIFGDTKASQFVLALHAFNIKTANDLVDVKFSTGEIKNRFNRWIKVPQMGEVRVRKLWAWKDEVSVKIKKAQQQEFELIKKKYEPLLSPFLQQEQQAQYQARQQKNDALLVINTQKQEASLQEKRILQQSILQKKEFTDRMILEKQDIQKAFQELQNEFFQHNTIIRAEMENKKNVIQQQQNELYLNYQKEEQMQRQSFEAEQKRLVQMAQETAQNFLQNCEQIFTSFSQEINTNYQQSHYLFRLKRQEITNFLENLQQNISELHKLQQSFLNG